MTTSLSETTKIGLGREVSSLDVSPQFNAYSGVEIIIDEDTVILAGNRTGGRVLTIENPWGTQAQANAILAALQANGFQYQPYSASGALLNPAAEIGDGITISDTYSGIYKMSRNYSPLMSADIEAPQDEEIDHEYPYEPKQDRIYKREIADAQAAISITQSQITSEVIRATAAEGTLSSRITQNANNITAKVSSSGGSNSSFAWSLNNSGFSLVSNNSTVFRCTASGVEISGKVTATSGAIGGFTIGSSALYNGMNGLNSTANGVYVGTNGISVGGGKFKVTSSGAVSAANMTLTGTLNIGGTNITAAALRSGAQSAYSNGSSWTAGARNGNSAKTNWDNALGSGISGTFSAASINARSSFYFAGKTAVWKTMTVSNQYVNFTINYLGYR